MRGHLQGRQRRRIPQARDLSERTTIRQTGYGSDGKPDGSFTDRYIDVPARHYRATGDQIYTEDTLRLENTLSFQIRYLELDSTDRVIWSGRDLEIRAIIDVVPRVWLQLDCRDSE